MVDRWKKVRNNSWLLHYWAKNINWLCTDVCSVSIVASTIALSVFLPVLRTLSGERSLQLGLNSIVCISYTYITNCFGNKPEFWKQLSTTLQALAQHYLWLGIPNCHGASWACDNYMQTPCFLLAPSLPAYPHTTEPLYNQWIGIISLRRTHWYINTTSLCPGTFIRNHTIHVLVEGFKKHIIVYLQIALFSIILTTHAADISLRAYTYSRVGYHYNCRLHIVCRGHIHRNKPVEHSSYTTIQKQSVYSYDRVGKRNITMIICMS